MNEKAPHQESEEIKKLLLQYRELRSGKGFPMFEEESFDRLVDYFAENDQLNKAIEAANYGINLFPYSSMLLIKKADLMITLQKFTEALVILDKVSVLDSSDSNLYLLKIEANLGLNRTDSAKQLYEESLKMFDEEERVEYLFQLAEVFDDYEQIDEVYECLKEILLLEPLNQEALYKICFWTDYTSKFEDSIELHQKLIDLHPYNHLAWFNLGTAFQGIKLYEKAIDAYLYATAIDEKFDYAYRNLGDAYIRIRDYRSAIEALNKVLELTLPEDVIYEALGYCYERLRDSVQARAQYRKALHMNPAGSYLYYKIAVTYMMEEEWDKAIDRLNQAIKILPDNPDYRFAEGQCYSRTGQIEEAISSFISFISSRPTSMKGWKELIVTLFDHGLYQEALNECEEAYLHTKGKDLFVYFKAAVLLKLGRKKEGLLVLEDAVARSPKNLKHFIDLDPSFLQRASIVRIMNAHLERRKRKKDDKN